MTLDEVSNRRGWKKNKMMKESTTIFPLEGGFPKVSLFFFFLKIQELFYENVTLTRL